MAQALRESGQEQQLGFFARKGQHSSRALTDGHRRSRSATALCAGCRAREARYGFRRHDDEPAGERPRTLCFECFRMELTHRQAVAARLARGWNASQARLPLEEKLDELRRRRGRAQIAARKALGA